MMSPRDALRSYRRAYQRGLRHWGNRTHPLTVELARRGDRLIDVYTRHVDYLDCPVEVVDALTTQDLTELKRMAEEGDDEFPF